MAYPVKLLETLLLFKDSEFSLSEVKKQPVNEYDIEYRADLSFDEEPEVYIGLIVKLNGEFFYHYYESYAGSGSMLKQWTSCDEAVTGFHNWYRTTFAKGIA
ncbi:MAG: hypothetical protein KME29_04900 [Calothrix sp. FI2-JRJ7]|jgi:hypothetical protein|nr:hypothetical protein [Calothrix sp. FI2-JRJ7]